MTAAKALQWKPWLSEIDGGGGRSDPTTAPFICHFSCLSEHVRQLTVAGGSVDGGDVGGDGGGGVGDGGDGGGKGRRRGEHLQQI